MSQQRLIVLDFTKGNVVTLYGDDATRHQQQVAAQWCTRHLHGGPPGVVSKSACPYCLAEAAQDKP